MSEMGWKSRASAAIAGSHDDDWSSDTPASAASASPARFGVAAMPPNPMRTAAMRRPSSVKWNPAITAEMSWSKRFEIL